MNLPALQNNGRTVKAKSHWAGSCCTPAAVAPAVVDGTMVRTWLW